MKKKLLSIILVCALALCLLPLQAFAGGGDGLVIFYYDTQTLERIEGLFSDYSYTELLELPFTIEQPDGSTYDTNCYYVSTDFWTSFHLRAEISQVGTHKLTSYPVPDGYEAVRVIEINPTDEWRDNPGKLPEDGILSDDFTITAEDVKDYEEGWFEKRIAVLVQSKSDDLIAPPVTPAIEEPSSWAIESVTAAIGAGLVPEALQSKYTTGTKREPDEHQAGHVHVRGRVRLGVPFHQQNYAIYKIKKPPYGNLPHTAALLLRIAVMKYDIFQQRFSRDTGKARREQGKDCRRSRRNHTDSQGKIKRDSGP